MAFDYNLDFRNTDFRKRPELYRVGKGEQGVLLVEPYKSEILPHWRFKTVAEAQASAEKIYAMFLEYSHADDFVGMDMARKFLQMGYTRARRYANHPSGRKYKRAENTRAPEAGTTANGKAETEVLPQAADWATSEKAQAARIFYGYYRQAKDDPDYQARKKEYVARYEK